MAEQDMDEMERMVQFMFAQACKSLALVKSTAEKHHLTSPPLHAMCYMIEAVTPWSSGELLETAVVIEKGDMLDGR